MNVQTVGECSGHNDAAASAGQVVDHLSAVEAAGKEMRVVGVTVPVALEPVRAARPANSLQRVL